MDPIYEREQLIDEIARVEEETAPLEPLLRVRSLSPQSVLELLEMDPSFEPSVAMTYPKRRPGCRFILFIDASNAASRAKAMRALKFKKLVEGCVRKTVKASVCLIANGAVGSYEIRVSPTEKCYAQILRFNRDDMDCDGHIALGCATFVSDRVMGYAPRVVAEKRLQRAPRRTPRPSKRQCVIS